LLDGTRDHAALQAELLARLKDGRLTANRGQERITNEAELAQLSSQFCTQALNDLRQLMVLQA
jgi:methyltransferase-like protein